MQDTLEFQEYKDRLASYSYDELIQTEPSPITEPRHTQVIKRAFETLRSYFAEDEFRLTLPTQRKANIEGLINGVYAQFDEIHRLRREAADQLAPSLDEIANSVQNSLEGIDTRFTDPFNLYAISNRRSIRPIVNSIESAAQDIQKTNEQLRETLREANLLVGAAAGAELFSHFLRVANGKSVEENDQQPTNKLPFSLKRSVILLIALIALSVFVIGAAPDINQWFFTSSTPESSVTLNIKRVGILLPIGTVAIFLIYLLLIRFRPGGYERAAMIWVILGFLAVVGTAIWAGVLLHNLGDSPAWDQLVPKIVTLLAPAYFIRLCIQNYRANKHLAVSNMHRATIARVVSAFAKNLERTEPELRVASLNAQASIYQKAAELVFDPGESGFLTRREGAGSSDSFFDGLPRPGSSA